jgi:hypothetical protein
MVAGVFLEEEAMAPAGEEEEMEVVAADVANFMIGEYTLSARMIQGILSKILNSKILPLAHRNQWM